MSAGGERLAGDLEGLEVRLRALAGLLGRGSASTSALERSLLECRTLVERCAASAAGGDLEAGERHALRTRVERVAALNAVVVERAEREREAAEAWIGRVRAGREHLAHLRRPAAPGEACDVAG